MSAIQIPLSINIPLDELVETVQKLAKEEVESQSGEILEIVRKRSKSILSTELDDLIRGEIKERVRSAVSSVINHEAVKKAAKAALEAATKEAVSEALKE